MATDRKQSLKKFVEYWTFRRGSEKGEDQQFWNSLLRDVLGIVDVERHIQYQVPVVVEAGGSRFIATAGTGYGDEASSLVAGAGNKQTDLLTPNGVREGGSRFIATETADSVSRVSGEQIRVLNTRTTKFLDAWIPETRVLIEHKSRGVNLDAPQSGHDGKTPYEQALEYDNARSFDEKARWIVLCNFDEFRIYDRTKPLDPPLKMRLADLPKEAHRLAFLVDAKEKAIDRELEISVQAGKIVGEIYDALLGPFDFKQTDLLTPNGVRDAGGVSRVSGEQIRVLNNAAALAALNRLCVRLVFCLYAEDADIFPKDCFRRLLEATPAQFLRKRLLDLFAVLDTPPERRDPYLEPELAAFPYTNGGLFRTGRTGFQPVQDGIESSAGTGKDARSPSEDARSPNSDAIPPLTEHIRQLLINASLFDWRDISPTIFGALFESTLNPQTRRAGGMHYTSIENIHKVIDPLFLGEFTARVDEILTQRRDGRAVSMKPPLGTGHGDAASSRVAGAGDKQTDLLTPNGVREGGSRFIATEAADRVSGVSREQIRLLTKKDRAALLALQSELASLTIFDPACGSGNFLTETYLSLRRLENRIIAALQGSQGELDLASPNHPNDQTSKLPNLPSVRVSISQFHGIEINDFAVSVAKTALWIAEAQMLRDTAEILHREPDFLPLKDYDGIVEGNALRIDWKSILEVRSTKDEVRSVDFGNLFIIGNPPFVGYAYQSKEQKDDLRSVSDAISKNVDYVAGWYYKAAELVGRVAPNAPSGVRCAFVSTNSICQGEQVAAVWKPLMEKYGVVIDFAHRSFRWDSEATEKAHVHCVIVGFHVGRAVSMKPPSWDGRAVCPQTAVDGDESRRVEGNAPYHAKLIFPSPDGAGATSAPLPAAHINAYLMDAPDIFIDKRSKPLCNVPPMVRGSSPVDDGNLILTSAERDEYIAKEPQGAKFLRPFMMGKDFIDRKPRWCFWLADADPGEIRKCPALMRRIEAVRDFRLKSAKAATVQSADTPTLFGEMRPSAGRYVAIAKVSSERRRYIPIDYLEPEVLAGDKLFQMQNATLFHLGVLLSSVHMAWMRAVCGRLEMRFSYSNMIVYNNFPWPFEVEEQTDLLASNDAREGGSRFIATGRRNGGFPSQDALTGNAAVSAAMKAREDARPPVSGVSREQIRVLKTKITATAQAILDARSRYPDSSLADLYDETFMPADLRAAHAANDRAVLAAYGLKPDASEAEIVAHLFRLYATVSSKPPYQRSR